MKCHSEIGLISKIGVTWIYTLPAGWLRIDYYRDML